MPPATQGKLIRHEVPENRCFMYEKLGGRQEAAANICIQFGSEPDKLVFQACIDLEDIEAFKKWMDSFHPPSTGFKRNRQAIQHELVASQLLDQVDLLIAV